MSAIIEQTKRFYQISFLIEAVLLFILSLFIFILQTFDQTFSFFIGGLVGFLPHCFFVFWFFFRQGKDLTDKINYFYTGEAIKWLITIITMIIIFKYFSSVKIIFFFLGYFFTLLINVFLPILLKLRIK